MTNGPAFTRGRLALANGRWAEAADAFEESVSESETAEALDGLGMSLWWLKRVADGMSARTRAYVVYKREGRLEQAAMIAVWLSREYRSLYGNDAAADGWLSRAESAVRDVTLSAAQGWIDLARCWSAPPAERIGFAGRAAAIARRLDDPDLEIVALARLGVIEVASGRVDEGIGHLDESMAAATSGEGIDPQSIGEACCALMEAAELIGDLDRVGKWSGAMQSYMGSYHYGPLASYCGACCGGMFLSGGRLDAAEKELLSAIESLEGTEMHPRCVHPVTQLAELRVVQGRFEEAREMLARYEDLPEAVRPLARLELALGSNDLAAARLRGRIAQLRDLEIAASPLLTLLVDAELACGDVEAAGWAAQGVSRIADLTRSRRHLGESSLAAGKVAAALGREDADALLRAAVDQLADASLPLATASARMTLARVASDGDVAVAEARAALAAFDRLGAVPQADAAAAFLRERGVKGRTGPKEIGVLSKRELEVLGLVAEGLSNREISERLFISVKTTGHHVSNILSKLQLRSRTEAAAFAALHLKREPVKR